MNDPAFYAALLLGAFIGALLAYLHGRIRTAALAERLAAAERTSADVGRERQALQDAEAALRAQIGELNEQLARAGAVLEAEQAKARELADAETRLKQAFAALASDALKDSNTRFLELAQQSFGELTGALARAMEALPARRREVFELFRFHGLSYAEIADVMGISSQTVANQMSSALAKLREALAPLMHADG